MIPHVLSGSIAALIDEPIITITEQHINVLFYVIVQQIQYIKKIAKSRLCIIAH